MIAATGVRVRLAELDALTDRMPPLCRRLDEIWRAVLADLRAHSSLSSPGRGDARAAAGPIGRDGCVARDRAGRPNPRRPARSPHQTPAADRRPVNEGGST
jgi:hypothetical protein